MKRNSAIVVTAVLLQSSPVFGQSLCTDSPLTISSSETIHASDLQGDALVYQDEDSFRIELIENVVRTYFADRYAVAQEDDDDFIVGAERLEARIFVDRDHPSAIAVSDLRPTAEDWAETDTSATALHALEVSRLLNWTLSSGYARVRNISDGSLVEEYQRQFYSAEHDEGPVGGMRLVTADGRVIHDFCYIDPD